MSIEKRQRALKLLEVQLLATWVDAAMALGLAATSSRELLVGVSGVQSVCRFQSWSDSGNRVSNFRCPECLGCVPGRCKSWILFRFRHGGLLLGRAPMASVGALEGSRRELSPDEFHSVIFATTGQPSIDSFPLMFTSSILSLSLLVSSPAQQAIDLLRERIQQCSLFVLPPKCDLHLEVEVVRGDRYIISARAGGSTCDNPGGSTLLGWFAVDGTGVVEIHHPSAAGDENEFEPLNCSTQEDD